MIEDLIITETKKFISDKGNIYHGLRNTDDGFSQFGEVYFSFVKKNSIKAWKIHKEMTLNIIVPVGSIQFNFIDLRENSKNFKERFELLLSEEHYSRVTIPPKICFGFKGIGDGINMLANVANIPHDDNENETKDLKEFDFIG